MADIDIVAGAGIWGCTVARRLAESGRRVLLIDKRPFIGGNCRAEADSDTGIEVHKYGSHIFHTSNRGVYDFVRRFADFSSYHHKVFAEHNGKRYPFPVSIPLLEKFYGREFTVAEASEALASDSVKKELFDAFFRGYTSKQWGVPAEDVDASVISRIPMRTNRDTGYFSDTWQGIPIGGYSAMFDSMVSHPNITIETSRPFSLDDSDFKNRRVFYSGQIDALFGYELGPLPWRGLRFETKTLDVADYQGTTVVNYSDADVPHTRVHEFKHYMYDDRSVMACGKTVVMTEYPCDWKVGDEPYYAVKSEASDSLYGKYSDMLSKLDRDITIGGRLGSYRYYDMDDAVEAALNVEI